MDRTVVRHRDGTRPAVPATRVKPDGTRGVCPQIGLATASETRTIRPRSGAGCPARSRAPRSGSRSCGPDIVMIKIITINMNIDIIKIIKILISSYHKIIILIRLAAQTRADTGLTQMRAGQPSWPHTVAPVVHRPAAVCRRATPTYPATYAAASTNFGSLPL